MRRSKVESIYERLLDEAQELLEGEGFIREVDSFRQFSNGLKRGLQFQRSQYETKNTISFTLNLGISSERLTSLLSESQKTPVWNSHVVKRIGFLLPDKLDKWWIISADTQLLLLSTELKGVISLCALPFLRQFPDDIALRHYLKNLRADGEASYDEAFYICLLDILVGSTGELESSIQAFRRIACSTGFSHCETETKIAEIHAKLKAYRPVARVGDKQQG